MVRRRQRRAGTRSGGRWRGETGYNLVFLVVMITVLNILVAKALPLWSAVIQREKEEELIFRGMQYAEAIRIYEMRTGGLPTKMEQLIETKPRCIRKLWKNPMAEDGSWLLIPPGQGQPGRRLNPDANLDDGVDEEQSREGLPGQPPGQRPPQGVLWIPDGDNEVAITPIFGVKSSVEGTSIKTFVTNPTAPGGGGSNEISEWLFTIELAKAMILPPDPANPNPIVPSMNVAQRFKPWPPGVRPLNVPNNPAAAASSSGGFNPVTDAKTRPNPEN